MGYLIQMNALNLIIAPTILSLYKECEVLIKPYILIKTAVTQTQVLYTYKFLVATLRICIILHRKI